MADYATGSIRVINMDGDNDPSHEQSDKLLFDSEIKPWGLNNPKFSFSQLNLYPKHLTVIGKN